MLAYDSLRYWTDARYRHDVDQAFAWANITHALEARARRIQIRAWVSGSKLGDRGTGYVVTARVPGALTVTLDNGGTLDISAPIPFI